jgi:hypothetical protein
MRRISAKFVPWMLSDDLKAHRVSVCWEQQACDDPNFISNIITRDETWVYGYDPETKQQSSQSRQIHRGRKKRVKSMVIFFSTSKKLSTRKSYPLVKQSMASFTVRFWSGWGRAFGANAGQVEEQQFVSPPWQRVRSHITRSTIPDFQKHYSDSPPPLFAWPRPLRLFPIPLYETTAERASFWQELGDPCGIARGYRHTFENFQGCMKSLETCWDHCIRAQGDYFEGDGGN